jgi:PLD-like domain/Trypsin-like peptidase domain
MADERELLREAAQRILATDRGLADQIDTLRGLSRHEELKPALENVRARVGALESLGEDSALALETIVNRVGRPVLEVANDDYVVEGPEAAVWEARLGNATVRAALRRVIPSVGRIEVDNHPDQPAFLGTGWLIADDVVVTNRHVAEEFTALSITDGRRAFVFKRGWPDRNTRMAARVDFRRELRNNSPRAFAVREVLHIEDDSGPDFAFLRVERTGAGSPLSPFLRPSGDRVAAQQYVATVGYPAADSRIPEQELMTRLFGDKYNVKRLAPGQVQRVADELVMHDCSTLGGNSGSPIVDLASGEVLGLHFSGVFLRENRGVPIGFVTRRLEKVLNPLQAALTAEEGQSQTAPPPPAAALPPGTVVSVTIPLQITLTLGTPSTGGVAAVSAAGSVTVPSVAPTPAAAKPSATVAQAVGEARDRLKGRSDVLAVRDGYVFRNGWITADPAVVVVLKDRTTGTPESLGLPSQLQGFPVDVRAASPWDVAAAQGRLEALEGIPRTTYKKPTGFQLEEVTEKMTVTCHVSPDAGWPTLREFLQKTKKTLTVGMYDFTAPHIIDGVLGAVREAPRKLSLVMQEGEALGGKPKDIPEEKTLARYRQELGNRFDHAPASVGKDHQFASAYHIKVAVRDGKAFWLSSGNWQSSNQPDHGIATGETSWDLLLKHNREWHLVIENTNLAKQFERYLQFDLKNAKADAEREAPVPPTAFFLVDEAVEERVPVGTPTYFKPLVVNREVQVRPLLTPDNYQEHVLALINTAERRLLFQNQSLSLLGLDADGDDKNDPRFAALADALLAKHKEGVDVRIIIRGEFAPVGPLEQLQKRGFDMGKVRLQNRCHTKGIIVDGARVLVGSHNWTNQGTLVNRDASLIFEDEEIAGYFEDIFWFDWKHLTRQSVGGRRARPAGENEAAPAGMRLVSWQEIVNGD